MSNRKFTDKEKEVLLSNIFVKSVGDSGVTYTDDFKMHVLLQLENSVPAKVIFHEAGFDIKVLGDSRIHSCCSRWKRNYKQGGAGRLRDTRVNNHGRPRKIERTLEQENEFLRTKLAYVQKELETVKKFEEIERRQRENSSLKKSEKFIIINKLNQEGFKNVKYLCSLADVSTSGYYNYFSEKAEDNRHKKFEKETEDIKLVVDKFNQYKFKKGSRQIKAQLKSDGVIMNLKKIQRIMRENDLTTLVTRVNPYKKMLKAIQESSYAPNILNRDFYSYGPGEVFLTDITYLYYGNSQRAYLSAIKDCITKQIVGYAVSTSLAMDFVIESYEMMMNNDHVTVSKNAISHSDQGAHYTSKLYTDYPELHNIIRSMSRRGNCWDNALMESFFGRLKSEPDFSNINSLKELKRYIAEYIYYYNEIRITSMTKNMTPNDYRSHIIANI